MFVINKDSLRSLTTGFKTIFNKAFEGKKPLWDKVATRVPSETGENLYAWLGSLPRFREWVGDRVIKPLSMEGYRIVNKLFEMTVSVPKTAIEDDQYGIYAPLMQQMGEEAKAYPDELVFSLLKNGFTEKCYDGKTFFATDHVGKGKRTYSNRSTKKLTAESYAAARASMMSVCDEEGKPMKITPNLLVVPPALEKEALTILKADQIDGTTNVYKGTAEPLVVPDLAGADTSWYLLDTTKVIKPLIFQERKPPEFVAQTEPDSEAAFMKAVYNYGCEARGNAGYSLWQLAYGSDGTTV